MDESMSSGAQGGGGHAEHLRLMLTDSRGVEGFEWYQAVEDLDLAEVPPAELRRLLGEARRHVWQLVQSCAEADRYEADHEHPGTHVVTGGEAVTVQGDDLLALLDALPDAASRAEQDGRPDQAEKCRRMLRAIEEGE